MVNYDHLSHLSMVLEIPHFKKPPYVYVYEYGQLWQIIII